jgi:hypothetical protein
MMLIDVKAKGGMAGGNEPIAGRNPTESLEAMRSAQCSDLQEVRERARRQLCHGT